VCASNPTSQSAPCPEQATHTPAKSAAFGCYTSQVDLRDPGSTAGCALPHDPGLDPILANPNLSATAKLIIIALVKRWAWYKDHCWPSDHTIAEAIGMSPGHVGRCLKELEVAGIIKRTRSGVGRTIWLLWRTTPGCDAPCLGADKSAASTPDYAPARSSTQGTHPEFRAGAESGSAPARSEQSVLNELENRNVRNETISHPTEDPDTPTPAPTPPLPATSTPLPVSTPILAPNPAPVAAPPIHRPPAPTQSVGPVMPLLDELKSVGPGTAPGEVRRIAARLCAALCDPGSLGGYIATISKVVAGTLSRDRLISAYKAGLGSVGKARSAGAIFQYTLANFVPPPKPSKVRYYQTRTQPVGAGPTQCVAGALLDVGSITTGAPAAEPAPTAEDIEALRGYAATPNHPIRNMARRRLAELGLL
jgi:hypothetical protein